MSSIEIVGLVSSDRGLEASLQAPAYDASFVAAGTSRLKLMVAHRPGFIAPTMAARALATLDQSERGKGRRSYYNRLSRYRTRRDGDYLTKEQRYEAARVFRRLL
jgi:alkanesulfonate monooxygenase